MPRILRIANRFNLGGPTFNVAYLTKYLPDNYETLLIGGDKEENEASSSHILQDLGIEPIIIPEMKRELSPGLDWNAYRKVKRIIRDFKPDIVHTHAAKAGAIGRQAAYDLKVPAIVHTFHGHVFHSYFGNLKTEFYKSVERNMAKKSSAIVAISEIQKKELSEIHRICEAEKTHVIPLGFDLSRFRTDMEKKRSEFRDEFNLSEDEVAIGIIGRLVPIKNHHLFVSVAKQVLDKYSGKVRFFIVGDGELRTELEHHCTQIGMKFNVTAEVRTNEAPLTFCSWRTDIDRINAGLDIIALTSKNEGTPVSLIEAQASGKPVVATDVGGTRNVVSDSVSGFVVKPESEAEMVSSILKLAESRALREKFGNSGRSIVSSKYHYNRLVNDMDELYEKLLNT